MILKFISKRLDDQDTVQKLKDQVNANRLELPLSLNMTIGGPWTWCGICYAPEWYFISRCLYPVATLLLRKIYAILHWFSQP